MRAPPRSPRSRATVFTDDRAPWAQQPGEGPKAFAAFVTYRDLPPNQRSLDAAWREAHPAQSTPRRRSKTWAEWSRQFGWVDRAASWDTEIDRQKRERFLKAQLDATERHQRAAQALLTLSTLPARTLLNRLQDPNFQQELDKLSGLALMRENWRAAAVVPAIANMERLALGLSTTDVVIQDRRDLERERAWTDKALANPKAVDLLVSLLDEMANPTPPPEPTSPAPLDPAGEKDPVTSSAQAPVLAAADDNEDDDD
jgi:hypothetical protein